MATRHQTIAAEAGKSALSWTPLASVRAGVLTGFAILVFILIAVVAGAVVGVMRYKSDTSEMLAYSQSTSALQEVEANTSVAALLTLRYVVAGGDNYPAEINEAMTAASDSLRRAHEEAVTLGDDALIAEINGYLLIDTQFASEEGVPALLALRQAGRIEEALAAMEQIVPLFRDYRLALQATADEQLAKVEALRDQADYDGSLALWMLAGSGIAGAMLGLALAFVISRSVIKPLKSLEGTALEVYHGNLNARAPVEGPRELSQLGASFNVMLDTIQERTLTIEERNRQLSDARARAATDGLTGLLNHREFQEQIRSQIASEPDAPFSVIMVDIDDFKTINDSLGHSEGDEILRKCASAFTQVAGEGTVFRYGGDEMVIILPSTGIREAEAIANRIKDCAIATSDSEFTITTSLGVSSYPLTARTAKELIYQADAAMYSAKSAGKNQVQRWENGSSAPIADSD
jgi:diguanylate cyclase (GGDEF)-like protein